MKIDYNKLDEKISKISSLILENHAKDNISSVFTSYMNKYGNEMLLYIKKHQDDDFINIEHIYGDTIFILDDTLSNPAIDREIAVDNLIDAINLLYESMLKSDS